MKLITAVFGFVVGVLISAALGCNGHSYDRSALRYAQAIEQDSLAVACGEAHNTAVNYLAWKKVDKFREWKQIEQETCAEDIRRIAARAPR